MTEFTIPHSLRRFFGLAFGALLLIAADSSAGQDDGRLNRTKSPNGALEIFHNDYNPYIREPADFSIVEVESGSLLHQISVPTEVIGRFVRSVEWLNDRYVLALGEGMYVTILDTVEGSVELSFLGLGEALYKNHNYLAFRLPLEPRYGPRPPLETDYVGIAWFMETGSESAWKAAVIYPEAVLLESFHAKDAATANLRHQIEGPLSWSEDGRSLAFAELFAGKRWLVVLDVPGNPLQTETQRFEVSEYVGEVSRIAWIPGQQSVEVTGPEGSTVIQIIRPKSE